MCFLIIVKTLNLSNLQGEGIDSNQHSFSQNKKFLTTIERQEHGSECLLKGLGVVMLTQYSCLS